MSEGQGLGRRITAGLAAWRPSPDATSPRDLGLRLGLVAVLALLTLALFPPPGATEMPAVRVGLVAPEDIIAPFDFRILRDEEELASLREQAALSVPPVFARRPAAIMADSALTRLDAWLTRFESLPPDETLSEENVAILNRVDGRTLGLRPVELRELRRLEVRRDLRALAHEVVPALYADELLLPVETLAELPGTQIALLAPDGSESVVQKADVQGLRTGAELPTVTRQARRLDPALERIALQVLPALAPPNLDPRPALTAVRRDQARRSISPIRGEVLSGELIVAAHTRVSPEQAQKMSSLAQEIELRRGGLSVEDARVGLGFFFLNTGLLLLLGFTLFLYRRDVFDDFRGLVVLGLIWGLVASLGAFVSDVDAVPIYAVPVALASVLVAVLWDTRLSVLITLFLATALGSQVELGYPVLWTGLFGGLFGAWSVRRIRRRTHFYETLLFITIGHVLALVVLSLMRLWGWSDFGVAVGWGALSAALSVFLAMGLLPILEWASGRTTDLTLLELADLNRPLLKQLLLDAPGTYHHSIIVGNLAEAATEGIGSNSLLARVGAYYHDIGKIQRPEYFIENQRQGENPHTQLSPRASARIVSRHVSDGVVMARAMGLPACVIDFIREHHGTTRLAYFWHKAGEVDPESRSRKPADFVYPGPRPRSKETAVVMLADSVEAASRVVPDPSPERFREVVRRIVETKLDEHQLDEADLTFRHLAIVEEKFVGVLTGIHHHRIDYPTVSLHAPEVHDGAAGQVPSVGRAPV